jgi:DNA (cytosine-5)-methyltransferase 1
MYGLAICAGGGGLELGLSLALGDDYRCLCYVEREAYAAATLVKRMGEGWLDTAPVWDNLDTFTGDVVRPFVGRIDLLAGGIPCQPHSTAGQQRGAGDERDLWPQTARLIREIHPGSVFLENVPPIARYYWERIRPELRDMGYETTEGIFSAAEVGANHRRERFFVLAYRHGEQSHLLEWAARAESLRSSHALAHPEGLGYTTGRESGRAEETHPRSQLAGADVSDAQGEQDRGVLVGELSPNPSPSGNGTGQTNWWATEPDVGRVANGVAHRVDRLRLTGNGVVPLQAAYAFTTLLATMKVETKT